MPKAHRSILVIPPQGGRVRLFRIRFSAIALLTLLSMAGIAGFFIPFSNFSLDVVELNQKKNLTEQNSKLLTRIHGMRQQLHELDDRFEKLESYKRSIEKIAGIRLNDEKKQEKKFVFDLKNIDRLTEYINNTEELYNKLARMGQDGSDAFERIPVIYPVVDEHAMTAGFGEMLDPFTGLKKWHYGVDFAVRRETPVVSTASGVVISVENHARWGRRIRIAHGYGFSTIYAHLGTVAVRQGQHVKRGEHIASVGITGVTTGPHVHYEIWRRGKPLDPLEYLFPDFSVASIPHEENEL